MEGSVFTTRSVCKSWSAASDKRCRDGEAAQPHQGPSTSASAYLNGMPHPAKRTSTTKSPGSAEPCLEHTDNSKYNSTLAQATLSSRSALQKNTANRNSEASLQMTLCALNHLESITLCYVLSHQAIAEQSEMRCHMEQAGIRSNAKDFARKNIHR